MSTTSSEVDFVSSDNEDDKPIAIREFRNIQLPQVAISDHVAMFDRMNPAPATDHLSSQQLVDRINWSLQVNDKLNQTLKSLQSTLQAEWAAKEHLLEKVLEKEIGGDWRIV